MQEADQKYDLILKERDTLQNSISDLHKSQGLKLQKLENDARFQIEECRKSYNSKCSEAEALN